MIFFNKQCVLGFLVWLFGFLLAAVVTPVGAVEEGKEIEASLSDHNSFEFFDRGFLVKSWNCSVLESKSDYSRSNVWYSARPHKDAGNIVIKAEKDAKKRILEVPQHILKIINKDEDQAQTSICFFQGVEAENNNKDTCSDTITLLKDELSKDDANYHMFSQTVCYEPSASKTPLTYEVVDDRGYRAQPTARQNERQRVCEEPFNFVIIYGKNYTKIDEKIQLDSFDNLSVKKRVSPFLFDQKDRYLAISLQDKSNEENKLLLVNVHFSIGQAKFNKIIADAILAVITEHQKTYSTIILGGEFGIIDDENCTKTLKELGCSVSVNKDGTYIKAFDPTNVSTDAIIIWRRQG